MTFPIRFRWRWLAVALFALSVWLALPALAAASSGALAPTQLFPWQQLWPIVIGALVPLLTYALNHVGPWVSQPVKALVLLVASAAATALYTALATNVIGLNAATLQLVLTSIFASLAAHHLLWKPSGVSTLLGAYADYGLHPRHGLSGPPVPVAGAPAAPQAVPQTGPTAVPPTV